jgi:4-hydroxymandelate oxidase
MAHLSIADYEAAARALLPPASSAFIAGGAGEERTLRANLAAFDSVELLPRVLVDVSRRSTVTTVLGQRVAIPILIAPSAMHRIAHEHGEAATARAAGNLGTIMVLSLGSSLPVEEVSGAATGPVWFQAYIGRDRGLTAEVIGRAEAAGCAALVVTVDAPVVGGRATELRGGFQILPEWFAEGHTPMYGLTAPIASGRAATDLWDASFSWRDLEWLRGLTGMPLVLKGVLRADDAATAATEGVKAVIVSNHGGRQLDTTPATLAVLPSIVAAVGDRSQVLMDGGIRRGTDVLKALALGATAVLVGRPVLWGLAVEGQGGVEHVLQLLADELDLAMALCGTTSVSDVDENLLFRT